MAPSLLQHAAGRRTALLSKPSHRPITRPPCIFQSCSLLWVERARCSVIMISSCFDLASHSLHRLAKHFRVVAQQCQVHVAEPSSLNTIGPRVTTDYRYSHTRKSTRCLIALPVTPSTLWRSRRALYPQAPTSSTTYIPATRCHPPFLMFPPPHLLLPCTSLSLPLHFASTTFHWPWTRRRTNAPWPLITEARRLATSGTCKTRDSGQRVRCLCSNSSSTSYV